MAAAPASEVSFFLFAVQIYGSRLFDRKLVTSGAYIRHPQYLCLSISAFGLFTMWPRMIIFLLFVGMLFAYYFLARVEERRMLILEPGYAEYVRGTGMFLPGNPGGRVYRLLFGGLPDQRLAHRLAVGSSVFVLLIAGIGLRGYTLAGCGKMRRDGISERNQSTLTMFLGLSVNRGLKVHPSVPHCTLGAHKEFPPCCT
jgi:hypothetical protein